MGMSFWGNLKHLMLRCIYRILGKAILVMLVRIMRVERMSSGLNYAVEMGFEFEYVANEHKRITACCIKKDIEGCPWRVHASICSANGHFVIWRLNNQHICIGRIRERKSGMMTSKIVCSILVEQLRSNPHIKPIQIVDDFKKNYGLDVSYYNAWYGKEMVMTMVHGDDVLSYQKLGWYVEEIRKSNPGSHCVLQCDPNTSHFRRLFIAFRGSIEGFNYCRPLLFLDGTFVKNKYKGTLLGATGKNGNQGFFPLAFALVDVEDEANWTWFLMNLSTVLFEDDRTITFILDRHKGLLQFVANVFPTSPHGFCIYHIEKIIKTTYPIGFGKTFCKKMVQLFKNCAYSSTP
nr:uncharacterized protein LOC114822343 [Malus domestica]